MLVWGAEVDAVVAPLFVPAPGVPPHGHAVQRIELRWRRPSKDDLSRMALGLQKSLARRRPERLWRVHIAGEPQREGPFAWRYGVAQVEGLALRAGHRMNVVPPEHAGRIGFEALLAPAGFPTGEADEPFVTPRAFTRAFAAVVTALPMPLKLHALRALITLPPAWRLENPAGGPAVNPDASWDATEIVEQAIATELAAERQRPIAPAADRGVAIGSSGFWTLRPEAGERMDDELDTAAFQSDDPTALPRLEMLRGDLLARPDRYTTGDGPQVLRALLEHLEGGRHLLALSREEIIHKRRAERTRLITREVEGALRAVGAGGGRGSGSDGSQASNVRLDPEELVRAWRSAPGWAWIEHVTRPGGGR
jgi:hypothetical protein